MRSAANVLVWLGMLAVSTPALADTSPYYDPMIVMAGSAKQMARAAKTAIECGIDFVTVRPWKDGDIPGAAPPFARPMSLIIQVSRGSDVNKVVSCFDEKAIGEVGIF